MLVAVTGGTGYLGVHTVRALLSAGHSVRLLVVPGDVDSTVIEALRAYGPVEVLIGDIRSAATISDLLTGCDAVLHAAGVVGTDSRRTQLMWDINAYATEALLTQAVELGLDPIVSVSSYSSLFPPPDGIIGPDTPPVPGRSDYARTKAYADTVARTLQASGAPVVVTYPSSVVGPAFHTPVGVTQRGWDPIVKHRIAPSLKGGMQMIDVGDVARVHTALMVPGRGPKRYVCGGVMLTFDQITEVLLQGVPGLVTDELVGVQLVRRPDQGCVRRAPARVGPALDRLDQRLVLVAQADRAAGRSVERDDQRGAGDHLAHHRVQGGVVGESGQLEVEVAGQRDGAAAVLARIGVLLVCHLASQPGQVTPRDPAGE